jgi:hypothetical protein
MNNIKAIGADPKWIKAADRNGITGLRLEMKNAIPRIRNELATYCRVK